MDADMAGLKDKRVAVKLSDGRTAEGVLWCDNDGTGRLLYTVARSGVSGAGFFDPEAQFYADGIASIERA